MPNMVFSVVGNVMILVHSARPPADAEWNEYLNAFRVRDPEKLRSIAFTDGGAPNTAQRKALNSILEGKTTLAAVVSPSSMVRGVVTALSWFNAKIRVFRPDEVEEAFKHLGVPKAEHALIWREIHKLRVKLGDDSLKSILKRIE
jgi:hypothetical protein